MRPITVHHTRPIGIEQDGRTVTRVDPITRRSTTEPQVFVIGVADAAALGLPPVVDDVPLILVLTDRGG